MKNIHVKSLPAKTWTNIRMVLAVMSVSITAYAQEGSQRNTTIFGGGQMAFLLTITLQRVAAGFSRVWMLTER